MINNSNNINTRAVSYASFVVSLIVAASFTPSVEGFGSPLFQETATKQKTFQSKNEGVEIELPNFDELFGRIKQVSPLARVAMDGVGVEVGGLTGIDDKWPGDLKWKTIESNKRKSAIVHQIDRIDNFMKLGCPILRFRTSINGPCAGECLAQFIMDLDMRKKWDAQIDEVEELYPIQDLDTANIAMGFGKYGDCSRLGVGYCKTKEAMGIISPREQLTLCGVQDFEDGSCVIWGTEMAEWHDHLLPEGPRTTRAKSHIFSTAMVPTSENSFDVEYVLQLEIGGKIPSFMTTPILTDNVKNFFKRTKKYFEGDEVHKYLEEKEKGDALGDNHSILMTP